MSTPTPKAELKYLSLLWATPDHVADIARLHAGLFEKAWSEPAIVEMLSHPGSIALLAGAGQPRQIGAFALAQVAADEAEILSIGVAPPWQRIGVGARLVDGIKRAAEKAGARKVFLEVAQSNAPALALYAKMGFAEVGRRKGYYEKSDGTKEDAIQLKASLGA